MYTLLIYEHEKDELLKEADDYFKVHRVKKSAADIGMEHIMRAVDFLEPHPAMISEPLTKDNFDDQYVACEWLYDFIYMVIRVKKLSQSIGKLRTMNEYEDAVLNRIAALAETMSIQQPVMRTALVTLGRELKKNEEAAANHES